MTMATPAGYDSQLGVLHLPCASLVSQLHDGLDQVVHAGIVRLRQQAAVGVDGQLSAEFDPSVLDEGPTFTPFAKACSFELQNRLTGEAVVDLGEIHVARLYPRHRVRARRAKVESHFE